MEEKNKTKELWAVWHVERYDYIKKENNAQVKGAIITISAMLADNSSKNVKGLNFMQFKIPYDEYENTFKVVPGLYEISTTISQDFKGNPTVKFLSARYVQDVAFEKEFC